MELVSCEDFRVYVSFEGDLMEAQKMFKALKELGVKPIVMAYMSDEDGAAATAASLSTWTFGKAGTDEGRLPSAIQLPLVTWDEKWDDYERVPNLALSADELIEKLHIKQDKVPSLDRALLATKKAALDASKDASAVPKQKG